jgi:hypothetical protein
MVIEATHLGHSDYRTAVESADKTRLWTMPRGYMMVRTCGWAMGLVGQRIGGEMVVRKMLSCDHREALYVRGIPGKLSALT